MSDARERARAAREALRQEREAAAAQAGKSATGGQIARQALLTVGLDLDDVASEKIDTSISYHHFAPARLNPHICQCGLLAGARIHHEPPHEYAPGEYVWGVCRLCHHGQTADCHDVRPPA